MTAAAAKQVLKFRHFLWFSLASFHLYTLAIDRSGLSFRRVTSSPVPEDKRDEAVPASDQRAVRVRALLTAAGVDMQRVTQLAIFATPRDNVAAVQPTDGVAKKQLRVTVSQTLLQPLSDDVPFDEQLRNAARTGDATLNVAQGNAVLVPEFMRHALGHHVAAQFQLSVLLILPPVLATLVRRRLPMAPEQSLMIANVAYLAGFTSVEQAWLPRVRARLAVTQLGPVYVDAALEAAELDRAANRQRHAQLVAASRSADWNTRVTSRFASILFSHNGNYLGDFGYSTTTQIRWLNEAKEKAAKEKAVKEKTT